MDHYGSVIGLPFAIEGFAFFIEAIFLGIYLYGWDRLSPRAHLLAGVPIVVAGTLSASSWSRQRLEMNSPQGFREENGKVVAVDPWKAIFNKATGPETTHMLLAAIMVTGFLTASVYAVAMLRGRDDAYHRLGLRLSLGLGALAAPAQVVVGDWAARYVAEDQPIKLAAMGACSAPAPRDLSIGGVYIGGLAPRRAAHPERGCPLLVHFNTNGVITGLETVPPALRPPVAIVTWPSTRWSAIGFGLLALGVWVRMDGLAPGADCRTRDGSCARSR